MPEGHTLHRLAAEYAEHFRGQPTRSCSPQGRFTAEAALIDGRQVSAAYAYGKHLFVEFGADRTVHVHLGLAGTITFSTSPADRTATPPTGTVRWRLSTDREQRHAADLRGPAACELLSELQIDRLLTRLGPDPLRADADPDAGWQRIRRSRTPIAALLMDQRIAAGVGNIYRAELLFRHRTDPMLPGRLLRPAEWQDMWLDLVQLMRRGVRTGRIDTVRPEHEPEAMGRAPRVDAHGGEVYVYRRAGLPCLVCGTRVRTAPLAGRNLFWCPRCQRRSRRKDR